MKEILIAALTGGALVEALRWGRAYWENHYSKKKSWSRVIPQIHKVYELLGLIIRETKADRIVILKTQNGGGIPKVGSVLYSSVLYESCETPMKPIRDHWKKQRLDEPYIKMLLELNTNDALSIKTEKLPNGMLKDLYEANKVEKARIYKIAEKPNKYIYLSIHYYDTEEETAKENDVIRYGINEIKKLFFKNDL